MTVDLSGKDTRMALETETSTALDMALVQRRAAELIMDADSDEDLTAIMAASSSIICGIAHESPAKEALLDELLEEFCRSTRSRFRTGVALGSQIEAMQ